MNKILLSVLVIAVIGAGGFYLLSKSSSNQTPQNLTNSSIVPTIIIVSPAAEKVDYQAGFAIFTNGLFRIFTAGMYHNRSADVYIEAKNPNIIQVKKKGVTWGYFFDTLPFKLTKDCLTTGTKETFCTSDNAQLSFYLNGGKTDNLLDLEIKRGDRALITYGNNTFAEIQKQMQKVPSPTY